MAHPQLELRRRASLPHRTGPFCIPEIERCVREALLQDDRITAVDDFSFEKHKKSIAATFTVHTIYGDIESETEVTI